MPSPFSAIDLKSSEINEIETFVREFINKEWAIDKTPTQQEDARTKLIEAVKTRFPILFKKTEQAKLEKAVWKYARVTHYWRKSTSSKRRDRSQSNNPVASQLVARPTHRRKEVPYVLIEKKGRKLSGHTVPGPSSSTTNRGADAPPDPVQRDDAVPDESLPDHRSDLADSDDIPDESPDEPRPDDALANVLETSQVNLKNCYNCLWRLGIRDEEDFVRLLASTTLEDFLPFMQQYCYLSRQSMTKMQCRVLWHSLEELYGV